MRAASRKPYRLRLLGRRFSRELIIVAWLGLCSLAADRFGLPVEHGVAIFFGGMICWALVAHAPRKFVRRRKAPSETTLSKKSFAALVGVVIVAAFGAALLWPPSNWAPGPTSSIIESAPAKPSFSCRVVSVHDGDGLRCADGTRVRLHAVAARETDGTCSPGHPCPAASAESARLALVRLAANDTITCDRIGQSYERVTAICRNSRGIEINCAMVQSGTTLLWPRFNREAAICR